MGLNRTYHSGGFVGGNPSLQQNEEYAKLMTGEYVSTPNMIASFMGKTLPQLVSNGSGGDTFNVEKMIEIIVTGSLDKTVLPELKDVVFKTINEIMKSRGMRRDSFSYSL